MPAAPTVEAALAATRCHMITPPVSSTKAAAAAAGIAPSEPSRGWLCHAASSYYSMIARLALAEAGIACEFVPVDIHAHMDQFEPGGIAA
jgi:hypothetical protein